MQTFHTRSRAGSETLPYIWDFFLLRGGVTGNLPVSENVWPKYEFNVSLTFYTRSLSLGLGLFQVVACINPRVVLPEKGVNLSPERGNAASNTWWLYSRYVEEHIQRTGVAIETQGFTFVTSGRKRESLTVSIQLLNADLLVSRFAEIYYWLEMLSLKCLPTDVCRVIVALIRPWLRQ